VTNLSPFAEITLEANPGTVDNQNIQGYAMAGVNRISLGVQSFNQNYLQALGRIHNGDEAFTAVEIAKKYFKKINLDLMYGLPKQTIEEALFDIETAISLSPEHISCYNLTIEKNTAFFVNPPAFLPDDDLCYDMEEQIVEKLALNGYSRYEVSAYAKTGYECQHNLNYWQFGDYLGLGAGAHSKLSFPDKIIRQIRQKQPTSYMDQVTAADQFNQIHLIEDKTILTRELAFEFMLNALRLKAGFATPLFVERTGLSLNTILPTVNLAAKKGLVALNAGKIIPTQQGYSFLNDLMMMFLC
jgi:oxygen-independent coproporphyrinogen-3 oxidase